MRQHLPVAVQHEPGAAEHVPDVGHEVRQLLDRDRVVDEAEEFTVASQRLAEVDDDVPARAHEDLTPEGLLGRRELGGGLPDFRIGAQVLLGDAERAVGEAAHLDLVKGGVEDTGGPNLRRGRQRADQHILHALFVPKVDGSALDRLPERIGVRDRVVDVSAELGIEPFHRAPGLFVQQLQGVDVAGPELDREHQGDRQKHQQSRAGRQRDPERDRARGLRLRLSVAAWRLYRVCRHLDHAFVHVGIAAQVKSLRRSYLVRLTKFAKCPGSGFVQGPGYRAGTAGDVPDYGKDRHVRSRYAHGCHPGVV